MDDIETFSVGGIAAPHRLAAAAGRDVMVEGGTVVEAALAAAAVSAVVVPDRNGLGGDALWLIREPGPRGRIRVLDARGTVGTGARLSFYRERDLESVPLHGGGAVLTVPGAVAGWAEAHALSMASGGRLPIARLLAPAAAAAREGWDLSARDAAALSAAAPALAGSPGFAAAFLVDGKAPDAGSRCSAPALAASLDYLAGAGLEDLYRGDVGRELSADLEAWSSPLGRGDLRAGEARWPEPHALDLGRQSLAVPPTRSGVRAAVALGLFAGLGAAGLDAAKVDAFERWHGLIDALRLADEMLDASDAAGQDVEALLDPGRLARASLRLDRERARPSVVRSAPLLDEAAVWIGIVDREGAAVSLIQTLGGTFGSGLVSGRTGILMGNRGAALAIDPELGPVLRPGRRPPLLSLPALLAAPRDGQVAALGGEGLQAATLVAQVGSRLMRGAGLGEAIGTPRFALGATPDGRHAAVLVEETDEPGPAARLKAAGHVLVPGDPASLRTAGGVSRDAAGRVAAASDAGDIAGL